MCIVDIKIHIFKCIDIRATVGMPVAREGKPLKGMPVARMARHAFKGIWATDSRACLSRHMDIYPYAYRMAKTDRMPCLYSHMTIDY